MGELVPRPRGCRIALIEDDGNLALLMQYNLEVRGCSVDCISDGTSALASLRAQRPDAVVLDWGLPGLAGIEVLRRIRKSNSLRHLPVLMLTARNSSEDRRRAMETGANAFFTKPFSIREVVDVLQGLIIPVEGEGSTQLSGTAS